MRKYFYFRDEVDEDNDDDVSSSITIPVSNRIRSGTYVYYKFRLVLQIW